ncbi:hypothetical protein D9615_003412 [Tricholomella constricta]|uniref:BRO domain-containing protein 1 n=1 Tax=Tricholomella constricta TaxID=117010 RepID=A0A8H5HJ11_9AGAR|nr:hypothetical protein D9615_003412 [Tricholomella constricta]
MPVAPESFVVAVVQDALTSPPRPPRPLLISIMAHQSPMISIPRKTTDDVDWTTPIRNLIAQSYGENPDNYAAECTALQRCRQDAVRGAGSDLTARDLLYKYFGQLELLELRFSEIKVTFPWHDAFTHKLTTQTSIAFEKASVLFQIASTHSSIAAAQARTDPEGLKRAFYYFRTCAGMLTYINDNFLHAPSTDLSRDVVKFLSALILAQATEVFFEKCQDEKKSSALVAKIAAQAASIYTTLSEEVKDFMGKGILDRNWVTVINIKSKYFSALAQYHRALADTAASSHGPALARHALADTLAKDALRLATSFTPSVSPSSSTLPADASSSLLALTKSLSALASTALTTAQRSNDLIYHLLPPSADTLPPLDPTPTPVAVPVPIHDVYATPEVQKTIGPDIFLRLVPLSVHESASVYSEEKAKLVRREVDAAEQAEGEARSALDALALKDGLASYRAMALASPRSPSPTTGGAVPEEVLAWRTAIHEQDQQSGPIPTSLASLARLRDSVRHTLSTTERDLELESRECEAARVRCGAGFAQEPSAALTRAFRQEVKAHGDAQVAAEAADAQVVRMWEGVAGEVEAVFVRPGGLEGVFRDAEVEELRQGGESLLDLKDEEGGGEEEEERAKIAGFVAEIEERLGRLNKIKREREEGLRELKDKIQTDDVSHLLLLNRRNTGVEPALFAAELEKFRPDQQRLASTRPAQEAVLAELRLLWRKLKDTVARGKVGRTWEEKERKREDARRRCRRAWEGYKEVRDGLGKGLKFYTELTDLTNKLRADVRDYVARRTVEREGFVAKLESEQRLTSAAAPAPAKPPPPPAKPANLDSAMASMSLRGPASPPHHQHQQQWQSTPPPPSTSQYGTATPPQHHSYGQQQQQQQNAYTLPPPPQSQSHYGSPPPNSHQPPSLYHHQHQTSPPPAPPAQSPYHHHQQNHHTPNSGSVSSPPFLPSLPPPPPPRPVQQSSFSPPPTNTTQQPQMDPYASLGMFNPGPPPPQPQQQPQPAAAYNPAQSQQHYGRPPPPPPQQQQQSGYNYQQPARQDSYHNPGAYQPPPPPQQQHQNQQGGFPPPPPLPQQQYQYGAPPPQQQGYQYGQGQQGYGL